MKSREHIVTNGRASFFACIWDDLRNAAMDCGWALALHGSLKSDMDIMAMPWVEGAKPVEEMIQALVNCFTDNSLSQQLRRTGSMPNNRTVYSIPIWADFYLDISIIENANRL